MGNIASQKIADKLINVQELLGVNQGELSELLGYSKSFVSAVANGHLPASRTLVLLLETLEENHRLKQELARSDAGESASALLRRSSEGAGKGACMAQESP